MLSNRRDIRQYIYVLDNIIRPLLLFILSLSLKRKANRFCSLFFLFFLCVTRTVVGPAGWAT